MHARRLDSQVQYTDGRGRLTQALGGEGVRAAGGAAAPEGAVAAPPWPLSDLGRGSVAVVLFASFESDVGSGLGLTVMVVVIGERVV